MLAGALVAGCSGGSSTGSLPPTPGTPTGGSLLLTLTIPVGSRAHANRKNPAFVVAATSGLEISAANASNVVVADSKYDVSATSTACTLAGSVRSCTFVFTVPAGGPYIYTLTSYDQAPVGGTIPAGANVLAVGVVTNPSAIIQGGANALNATLEGKPKTLAFAPGRHVALSNGAVASFPIPLGVTDASATAIVGAFSNAVTASVNDVGAHTLLSIDGGLTKSASVQLLSSTDAADLVAYYDGTGAAGYTAAVSASGAGTTGGSSTIDTFAIAGSIGFGTPVFAGGAAAFTAPSQQLVLHPSETNFSGTFSRTDTCAGTVTISTAGANYDLQSVLATGSCHVDVSDGSQSFRVPISLTTTGASIGIPPPSGSLATMATLGGSMQPWEITNGPDGKLWFAGNDGTDGELGSLSPAGTLAVYPVAGASPVAVAVGGDGRIWYGDASDGKIRAIDPTTHAISTYDLSASLGFTGGLAAGPDGNMWITDGGSCHVDIVSVAGALVTQDQVPFCSALSDIIEGPDGAMWVGDQLAGQLARIDVASGAAQRFPITFPSAVGRMTVGHDGAIWMSIIIGGGVGRLTAEGAYAFYPSSSTQPEFGIVSAPDNSLYFSSCGCSGGVDRITTDGTISSIVAGPFAFDLAVGSDGGIWFTDNANGTILRVQP